MGIGPPLRAEDAPRPKAEAGDSVDIGPPLEPLDEVEAAAQPKALDVRGAQTRRTHPRPCLAWVHFGGQLQARRGDGRRRFRRLVGPSQQQPCSRAVLPVPGQGRDGQKLASQRQDWPLRPNLTGIGVCPTCKQRIPHERHERCWVAEQVAQQLPSRCSGHRVLAELRRKRKQVATNDQIWRLGRSRPRMVGVGQRLAVLYQTRPIFGQQSWDSRKENQCRPTLSELDHFRCRNSNNLGHSVYTNCG